MIKYLKHEEIEKHKWDAAIDASPHGLAYAKSWYLDIVSPGWEALVAEDYDAVFPLTSRKKYGMSYLHQPFFTQQLGIFSKEKLNQDLIYEFLSAIPQHFRLIEIQLNHTNIISQGEFNVSPRLTHHLDLNQQYDSIQKNYSENLRRNIKRGHQNGLEVTGDFSTTALTDLFKMNRGKDVGTLRERDYLTFKKIVEEGERRKLIIKKGIVLENRLEAGAIFLQSNHEYIFLFSATGKMAKETGAMALIIDQFIKMHSPSALKLDFEGSMDPGLARFYKSFGSKEVVYLQIRKNNLPMLIRWLK